MVLVIEIEGSLHATLGVEKSESFTQLKKTILKQHVFTIIFNVLYNFIAYFFKILYINLSSRKYHFHTNILSQKLAYLVVCLVLILGNLRF